MKPRTIGILLGLLLAGVILWWQGRGPAEIVHGPLISECEGHLRRVVIQYRAGATPAAAIYREFLSKLDADVQVIVLVPGKADLDELQEGLGPLADRLTPVDVGHAVSNWSRDRWLIQEPRVKGASSRLLCPSNEAGAEVWPERAGDALVGFDLAKWTADVTADRSRFGFDGGDFLCDGVKIFLAERMLSRNIPSHAVSAEDLRAQLTRELGLPVTILTGVPPHHVAMYMAAAKPGVMVVGDPAWGQALLVQSSDKAKARAKNLPQGADFSPKTIQAFNAAADQATAAGCRVIRIPVIPGGDGRAYITYTNVLIDGINLNAPMEEIPRPIVYLPVYDDMDLLNAAAQKAWESLGYEVRTINCTGIYEMGGVIHCLVNVIDRVK